MLRIYILGFLLACIAAVIHAPASSAAYDGSSLIGDSVFTNTTSMTPGSIQSFLNSQTGTLKDRKFYFNCTDQPKEVTKRFKNMGAPCDGDALASDIIYYVGRIYGINPQVIIATLQKEQSLITDANPQASQLNSATGYGCPTTGSCSGYTGFFNQVDWAAWQFRQNYEGALRNGAWWNGSSSWPCGSKKNFYSPGLYPHQSIKFYDTNNIHYQTYTLNSAATSALYCYTPHATNNFPGCTPKYGVSYDSAKPTIGSEGDCFTGSYIFVTAFERWFGSTHYTTKGAIKAYYDQVNGSQLLGNPTANEVQFAPSSWYQCFQYGCIIGSSETGFWESRGAIRTRWGQLGYQSSPLGLPIGPEQYSGGAYRQAYQHGLIIGNSKTGFWEAKGAILNRWAKLGYQGGSMGIPAGPEVYAGGTGYYQKFTGGYIVGNAETGFWDSRGAIRTYWGKLGYQNGSMGYPTGSIQRQDSKTYYQQYQNGKIFHRSPNTNWTIK